MGHESGPAVVAYVAINLRVNGGFYLGDERFPVVFTLLAVIGLFDRPFRTGRLCVGAYFLLFFGMYLSFYAGSYNYGADVRYSLMTYPPLAILGGLGAARVATWIERVRLERLGADTPAQGLVTAGLVFQFLWYAPLVRATTEEAWAARADVRFAQSLVPELRGNTYVLDPQPRDVPRVGHQRGADVPDRDQPAPSRPPGESLPGGVYLHWNFWCNVQDPIQREFCQKALAGQKAELVREYYERGQRFAIYRLSVFVHVIP